MFEQLIAFLQSHTPVSVEEINLIRENTQLKRAKEGELLLREGNLAKELFFICTGFLKIVTINAKGNEVTQFFLRPNQFCTILNSFNNSVPAHESIVAACDAELVVFPKENLLVLYQQIAYFKELIDKITHQAVLNKIALRNGYLGEEASVRYRRFLQQQPDIALHVPLKDIASYLGITPQSFSRIRRNAGSKK